MKYSIMSNLTRHLHDEFLYFMLYIVKLLENLSSDTIIVIYQELQLRNKYELCQNKNVGEMQKT